MEVWAWLMVEKAELEKVLASLKGRDNDLNVKQGRLQEDYDGLSSRIFDIMKGLKRLQERREGLKLRLSAIQEQSRRLGPIIKERETRLEAVRARADDALSKVEALIQTYSHSAVSSSGHGSKKRDKLGQELKRSKQRLKSKNAKRLKLQADVEVSKRNLQKKKSDSMLLNCPEFCIPVYEQESSFCTNCASEVGQKRSTELETFPTASWLESGVEAL
ncbi:hypothetical protein R1sor_016623 [Riccia sorocarpa]|uniref:Uncharacterized protein n=1 Tax=Riccia sorocarpa TaxID=122646 RepID=A0ABD3HIU8_9MARC